MVSWGNGVCNVESGQPCFKCVSCKQCCEYRECDVCFARPGTTCCECDWYHCDICGADRLKCPAQPLCQAPCQPGNGVCDCNCQDSACSLKPCCDTCAVLTVCNCTKGCEVKCCTNNFKCCKFTECGKNCGAICKMQCKECVRPCHDCPDCGTKCKTFYSKCGPQCKRECEELKSCCKMILPCVKNCFVQCPRRCRQAYCGGREVKIELDVYGPDGDDYHPACKIVYTGTSGWACGCATLRPKYVTTINVPATSPYYQKWRGQARACDFVDIALLVSLAIWYDFWTVAPREMFQCAEPLALEGNEKWPETAYHEYRINPALPGSPHWKEPENMMIFRWLYGDDFVFLLDPKLYLYRFNFIQDNPAGTLPIKEVDTASSTAQVNPEGTSTEGTGASPAPTSE